MSDEHRERRQSPSESAASTRPRQVTMAGIMSVVGSALLVVGLFDTMARLRTPGFRETVDDYLTRPPGSGLGLDVAQAVDLLRILAMVVGALAAMSLVFAVYVLKRHVPARIGFTIVAGLLLLTVPLAGPMPLLLAVAAVMLWSQPARQWFSGATPARPGSAMSETAGGGTPPPQPSQQPSQQPYQQPYQQPSQQPPQPPQQPYQQPPPPPPSYSPSYSPTYAGQPYAQQVGYGVPWDKRPATVLWAAILTWVGSAIVGLAMGLVMVLLAAQPDSYVSEFRAALQANDLTIDDDRLLAIGWGVTGVLLFWALSAAVLAGLVLRRSNAARILLAISAGVTVLVSGLMILSLVSVVPLLLAVTTLILLFTGGANPWFAGRPETGARPGPW